MKVAQHIGNIGNHWSTLDINSNSVSLNVGRNLNGELDSIFVNILTFFCSNSTQRVLSDKIKTTVQTGEMEKFAIFLKI